MIREIRLFLYFAMGVLLSVVAGLSYAETIPVPTTLTPAPVCYQNIPYGGTICDLGAAQANHMTKYNEQWHQNCSGIWEKYSSQYWVSYQGACGGGAYVLKEVAGSCPAGSTPMGGSCSLTACPEGQNWTRVGAYCERPDCRADQERNSSGVCACASNKTEVEGVCKTLCPTGYHRREPDNGQCEADCIGRQTQAADGTCKCAAGQTNSYSYSYGDGAAGNCSDGCAVKTGVASFCPGGLAAAAGLKSAASVTCYTYGTTTGGTCGSNSPMSPQKTPVTLTPSVPSDTSGTGSDGVTKDPKNTPDNNKDPAACGAAGGTYYTSNGVGKCGTSSADNSMDKLTTKSGATVTTNPDGTKTETKETTTSIQNQVTGETVTSKSSTTTTKDAAGNVTGTGTSTATSSGNGDQSGKEPGQCAKEPDSPMCRKGLVTGEKGKFEKRDQEIEAAKIELKAAFNSVSAEVKTMFSSLSVGAGGLPCPPSITVLGRQFRVCSSDYSSQLSIIGTAIYLAAVLAAAFIIFRS